jgi:DNA-directed RNA polymerase sigma subunit (sigma70/sigma32)
MNNSEFSNLGAYGSDINGYKLLTPENEKKVCIETANGCIKSRNELISSNLRLVIKIAMKYIGRGVELDELIAEGNKGLITAATRFNPHMDNKFSTYAYIWIRQAILASIEDNKEWNSLSGNNILNYGEADDYNEKELAVNMN